MSENRIIADRRTFLEQLGVGLLGVVAIARRPLLVTPWGTDAAQAPIRRLIDPTQPYAYTANIGDWWVRWTVARQPDGSASFVPGLMRTSLQLNSPRGFYVHTDSRPVVVLRRMPGLVELGARGEAKPNLAFMVEAIGTSVMWRSPIPWRDLNEVTFSIDEDRDPLGRVPGQRIDYIDAAVDRQWGRSWFAPALVTS